MRRTSSAATTLFVTGGVIPLRTNRENVSSTCGLNRQEMLNSNSLARRTIGALWPLATFRIASVSTV